MNFKLNKHKLYSYNREIEKKRDRREERVIQNLNNVKYKEI